MKHRLTLVERNSIAIALRIHILEKEDFLRLASIQHPDLQTEKVNRGVYAFEFFLDRYRGVLTESTAGWVSYIVGWSKVSLLIDEQSRSNDRIIRMCADLCMNNAEERGEIEDMCEKWKLAELGELPLVENNKLTLFFYEIIYEIVRELARGWASKTWDNTGQ